MELVLDKVGANNVLTHVYNARYHLQIVHVKKNFKDINYYNSNLSFHF